MNNISAITEALNLFKINQIQQNERIRIYSRRKKKEKKRN